jgi:hypothetical protein
MLLLGTAAAIGCTSWPHLRSQNGGTAPAPRLTAETPDRATLVAYLNRNASLVQSIQCRSLDLDCRQRLQSVGLEGWMVCQKPRNFRMGAKVLGKEQVDMGSNGQEFWYWIGRADPPYLFHCSHADLARGNVAMPFPFQPDWIVEALGVAEYGPPENFQVIPHPNTIELVERSVSPQGQPVRKVTVFRPRSSPTSSRTHRARPSVRPTSPRCSRTAQPAPCFRGESVSNGRASTSS